MDRKFTHKKILGDFSVHETLGCNACFWFRVDSHANSIFKKNNKMVNSSNITILITLGNPNHTKVFKDTQNFTVIKIHLIKTKFGFSLPDQEDSCRLHSNIL